MKQKNVFTYLIFYWHIIVKCLVSHNYNGNFKLENNYILFVWTVPKVTHTAQKSSLFKFYIYNSLYGTFVTFYYLH